MTDIKHFAPKHLCGATKRRSSKSTRPSHSLAKLIPPISTWGAFAIGFFLGILITTITILTLVPASSTLPTKGKAPTRLGARTPASSETKVAAAPPAETVTASKEPRFEFYTELAGESHSDNKSKAHSSSVLDLKSPTKAINMYLVQAGSFKNRADADALKARLALNGLTAKIELVQLNENEYWHRVLLGPFQSETQATEHKMLLKTLAVDSILVLKSDIKR